jgi:hypothetical protein
LISLMFFRMSISDDGCPRMLIIILDCCGW